MEKQDRIRKPGAGRKPVEDKIKMIPIYIRINRLAELGGEDELRKLIDEFIKKMP